MRAVLGSGGCALGGFGSPLLLVGGQGGRGGACAVMGMVLSPGVQGN